MDAFVEGLYEDDQVTVKGLAVLSVVFTILWTSLDFGCLAVKGLFRAVGVDAGERRQRLFFLSSIHAVVVTAFSAYVRLLLCDRPRTVDGSGTCPALWRVVGRASRVRFLVTLCHSDVPSASLG